MTLDTLADADRLDLALRQGVSRVAEAWLDFAELAVDALTAQVYVRFGFADPAPYFQDRIGVAYRTVQRYVAVAEALRRIADDAERQSARRAVVALGIHRAAILAPLLSEDWHKWTTEAQAAPTEAALQEAVSRATGAQPRGPATEPGERFLRMILARMPDRETQAEVEATFAVARRVAETRNNVGAFLAICREFRATWAPRHPDATAPRHPDATAL